MGTSIVCKGVKLMKWQQNGTFANFGIGFRNIQLNKTSRELPKAGQSKQEKQRHGIGGILYKEKNKDQFQESCRHTVVSAS